MPLNHSKASVNVFLDPARSYWGRGGLSFTGDRIDYTPSWTRWRPTCDKPYTRDAFLMTGGGFRMHVGCFPS